MGIININLQELNPTKVAKIKLALGIETKQELEELLENYLITEVKARLVQKAKREARELNDNFDLGGA